MQFLRSTIALKVMMALSGLVMVGFVVAHMAGNLQAWIGAERFNEYAKELRLLPEALWGVRIVLFVSVVTHVYAVVQLIQRSAAARPVAYAAAPVHASTWSSRLMKPSGFVLLGFVVYHLMHMTWGQVHPDFVEGDAFHNLVSGFQNPVVVLFYAVAMASLGLHLHHGFQSGFQTLGLNHPHWTPWRDRLTVIVPVVVAVGFVLIPLAVLFGIIA